MRALYRVALFAFVFDFAVALVDTDDAMAERVAAADAMLASTKMLGEGTTSRRSRHEIAAISLEDEKHGAYGTCLHDDVGPPQVQIIDRRRRQRHRHCFP